MADAPRTLNTAQKALVRKLADSLVNMLLDDRSEELRREYRPGTIALLEMLVCDAREAESSNG